MEARAGRRWLVTLQGGRAGNDAHMVLGIVTTVTKLRKSLTPVRAPALIIGISLTFHSDSREGLSYSEVPQQLCDA